MRVMDILGGALKRLCYLFVVFPVLGAAGATGRIRINVNSVSCQVAALHCLALACRHQFYLALFRAQTLSYAKIYWRERKRHACQTLLTAFIELKGHIYLAYRKTQCVIS